MPEMWCGLRKIPAHARGRQLGAMRKMRQRQGKKAGLLLRHIIRGKKRKHREFQILSFLWQLFRQPLQHLPLTPRSTRFTVDGVRQTVKGKEIPNPKSQTNPNLQIPMTQTKALS
jgi:hypothetical protein